jgi:hypothetical protein
MATKKMNLKLLKLKSVLDDLVLNEPVNMEMLEALMNSTVLRKEERKNGEFREDELKLLHKYKIIIKQEGDTYYAKVKYLRKKWCGRVGADKGVGLCPMRSVVRHTLAKAVGFVDIDIVNAHPEILVQLCKANGLACASLEYYVINRDNFLKHMMDEMKITRGVAKEMPLRIMYLGELQAWATDNGVNLQDIPDDILDWSDKIKDELTKIATRIEEDNPKLVKEVEKGTHDGGWNRTSAILSTFLQEYENRILEVIYTHCYNKGFIKDSIAVLAYDGIMLRESDLGQGGAEESLLESFSAEIKRETGFILKLTTKALDKALSLNDLKAKQITDDIFKPEVLGRFDTVYFNKLGDYRVKKLYFEKFVSKVLRPDPAYIYCEKDGIDGGEQMCFYNQGKITETFGHLKSGEVASNGEEIKFMTKWLNDNNIKLYNRMDFQPYNERRMPDVRNFNLFRGFSPATKTPYTKADADQILKPFHELGTELSGGDKTNYEFLLSYLADIIQNPEKKCPLAFIIKGKQGTGKNVWLNAFGKLLGAQHYISSSNPRDFFGDYAEGFYHKLLVNMNECEGKDTFQFEGRIKSFITEETITLNRKFVQEITIANLARVIIFTNKPNPIPIDVTSKDRRFVVYETTDKYLHKSKGSLYWKGLIAHFNSPIFTACLYDYLNNLDISKFDTRKRPITDAYIRMCSLYVPIEALFLTDKISKATLHDQAQYALQAGGNLDVPDILFNEWKNKGVKGDELYDQYTEYCKKKGFYTDKGGYQKNVRSFYHKLGELDLPIFKIPDGGVIWFRFNSAEMIEAMKTKKWIDYDKEEAKTNTIIETESEGQPFIGYFTPPTEPTTPEPMPEPTPPPAVKEEIGGFKIKKKPTVKKIGQ